MQPEVITVAAQGPHKVHMAAAAAAVQRTYALAARRLLTAYSLPAAAAARVPTMLLLMLTVVAMVAERQGKTGMTTVVIQQAVADLAADLRVALLTEPELVVQVHWVWVATLRQAALQPAVAAVAITVVAPAAQPIGLALAAVRLIQILQSLFLHIHRVITPVMVLQQ